MSDYANTCSGCDFVKTRPWEDELTQQTIRKGIPVYPPMDFYCSNPKSPYYDMCVIGSWGCIYSTHIPPNLLMPDGTKLSKWLEKNG